MKMTEELCAFIKEYCEYGWRDINNTKFYIWIPIYCVDDFIDLIDFNIFEYSFIEDCALSKDSLCIELSYFVDYIEQWFEKEN